MGDNVVPHVLVLPFPVQGHINAMLRLAELLCLSGIRVTFLATRSDRDRRPDHLPALLHLASFYDGLPERDVPLNACCMGLLLRSLQAVGGAQLRHILVSSNDPPVTCVVADGILTAFAVDVCTELAIPLVAFRTISACVFWVYHSIPHLFQAGDLPFPPSREDEAMDELVEGIGGMDRVLRRRDLPLSFRSVDGANAIGDNDALFGGIFNATRLSSRASALLFNTLEELEGPVLSLIRRHVHPKTFAVGPLHVLARQQAMPAVVSPPIRMSLWEEEGGETTRCLSWLDTQPPRSVVYVCFGSLAVLSAEQLEEIANGLASSGHTFLWALRPNSVATVAAGGTGTAAAGGNNLGQYSELVLCDRIGSMGIGRVVGWVSQEDVLVHPAVGCFFTHSGWNSTLEGIAAGVPMLCWPFFADQQVNSRYVGEVWKLGIDIKDRWDRCTVEKAVRELMAMRKGDRGRAICERAAAMADRAMASVREGGSSHSNLLALIEEIKNMSLKPPSKLPMVNAD